MNRLRIGLIATFVAWVTVVGLLVAPPVAAHFQVRQGEYELTVGWRVEPAIVGSLNGLALEIQRHLANNTTVSVLGAENNLTATLKTGPATVLKALVPQDNRPGWYTFDVIPTVAGAYSVHLVGRLNTTIVNVTVDLDPVAQSSDYQFPVSEPSATDLQNSIAQLNAQLATLQGLLTALITLAVVAVLVGAASLAFAIRTLRAMRRTP